MEGNSITSVPERVDPLAQLLRDRARARERQDPCASLCTVANVDEQGLPQLRTLVLREVEGRLALFVNSTSPKWQALNSSAVGVLVWLPTLNVQYRLACDTSSLPEALVHESWLLRPDAPKRMDWLYTAGRSQSSVIESREELLAELAAVRLPEPLTAPHTARGLFLAPRRVERLDLNQPDGVHERHSYELQKGVWLRTVLTP